MLQTHDRQLNLGDSLGRDIECPAAADTPAATDSLVLRVAAVATSPSIHTAAVNSDLRECGRAHKRVGQFHAQWLLGFISNHEAGIAIVLGNELHLQVAALYSGK